MIAVGFCSLLCLLVGTISHSDCFAADIFLVEGWGTGCIFVHFTQELSLSLSLIYATFCLDVTSCTQILFFQHMQILTS